MLMAHLSIFFMVFLVMLGVVNAIPSLFKLYQQRYQASAQKTTRELNKFFLNIKPAKVLIGAGVLGLLMGYLSGSWVVTVAIVGAGLIAPRIILSLWKDIRSAQFEAQLMDALLLIANSLKSGLDMVAGLERVAQSMKPPISEEFGLVVNSYRLGTPLETGLMELTTRINSRTLETAVYAINIQRETGGNIIKTFDQLILTIREESKLQKKVQAITSQGRTQIFFLAGFPWVLAVIFYFIAPDFIQPALGTSWGQLTALFLLVWEAIGISVTKKIVAVDV
jgi:tight adherence protein B